MQPLGSLRGSAAACLARWAWACSHGAMTSCSLIQISSLRTSVAMAALPRRQCACHTHGFGVLLPCARTCEAYNFMEHYKSLGCRVMNACRQVLAQSCLSAASPALCRPHVLSRAGCIQWMMCAGLREPTAGDNCGWLPGTAHAAEAGNCHGKPGTGPQSMRAAACASRDGQ